MSAISTRVAALTSSALPGERDRDFTDCVAACQRRVFRIAYSVLGNSADAEEVAQEAFLHAYRRFAFLRQREKFGAWVSRAAFRLALNRQRARRRQLARDTAWHSARADSIPAGARGADDQIYLDFLRGEIDRLPDKLRTVLLLCAVEDMTCGEVAAVLGIPEGTVRSRRHSARKQLWGVLNR
jgi:RNA polymerase sigma-70 factor (ECF subfamily)